ncbi:MAG: hypothetical protein JRI45_02625 [Deltaproteobacteria bacterium]|nr:hypothetical protein [Deltaproteobacteria bacterium]MBW2068809.1 hypothetical protein [Deltaproteobacteria bacterium]
MPLEDDLIASLTQQVQEEVIENYLHERRLIDLQLEELEEMARLTLKKARKAGKRFTRMGYLLIDDSFRNDWAEMVGIQLGSYWFDCLTREFQHDVRFIKVTALTNKGKFKKLFFEAYKRLVNRMDEYRSGYEEFRKECDAVNINIKQFHNNYDVLTIIRFLKSMDVCGLERKKILGENFSPEELMSIDKKLYFKPVQFESWKLPEPAKLPAPKYIEHRLDDLAQRIYQQYGNQIKGIIR